jgi:hypothetical protein
VGDEAEKPIRPKDLGCPSRRFLTETPYGVKSMITKFSLRVTTPNPNGRSICMTIPASSLEDAESLRVALTAGKGPRRATTVLNVRTSLGPVRIPVEDLEHLRAEIDKVLQEMHAPVLRVVD